MMSFAALGNQLYSGEKSFDFVGKRRIWITTGLILIAISAILLGVRGLNPGIEFRGGAEFTVSGVQVTQQDKAYEALRSVGIKEGVRVSELGTSGMRIQTQTLTPDQTETVRQNLMKTYGVQAKDVASTSIGPSWGQSVTVKAAWSLVVFLSLVALLLAFYFRTWKMSAAALIALTHDMIITGGFFALTQVEISPATLIGLLTILGYSLYDTVVVFDKIRELTTDFTGQRRRTYKELVNLAINQTLVRSINTSVVALLPVGAILFIGTYLLGAGTLRDISLALFVGMIIGTLSSVFLASPLLTVLREREAGIQAQASRVAQYREATNTSTDQGESVVTVGGPVVVGYHQGQSAQPRRKSRKDR